MEIIAGAKHSSKAARQKTSEKENEDEKNIYLPCESGCSDSDFGIETSWEYYNGNI